MLVQFCVCVQRTHVREVLCPHTEIYTEQVSYSYTHTLIYTLTHYTHSCGVVDDDEVVHAFSILQRRVTRAYHAHVALVALLFAA